MLISASFFCAATRARAQTTGRAYDVDESGAVAALPLMPRNYAGCDHGEDSTYEQ